MSKTYDLTGMKFGRLTVLCESPNRLPNTRCKVWECRCDCGNICYASTSSLRSGNKKSCGCIHKIKYPKDLTGIHFGKLVVIERGEDRVLPSGQRASVWKCRCSCCGKTISAIRNNLISGATKSCGSRVSLDEALEESDKHKRFIQKLKEENDIRKKKYESVLGIPVDDTHNVYHLNCVRDDYRKENLWYTKSDVWARLVSSRFVSSFGYISKEQKMCGMMYLRLIDTINEMKEGM